MRYLLLMAGLMAGASGPAGATAPPDSTRRAARPWYCPRHVIGQFAGGQGLGALGVGYATGRGRLHLDALAGYVPEKYSITPMGIFTAKATFAPWTLAVPATRWQLRPFTTGAFVSYTASKGLNDTRDGKYGKGYYWWSSHTRIGCFVGGQAAFRLPKPGGRARTAALYYELGSNDLYLTSLFTNWESLTFREVLTLGFGLKVDL